MREVLSITVINNMSDAALEATEAQFRSLLQAATGELPIQIQFSYLPEVARSDATRQRLQHEYLPLEQVLDDPPDGLIVTGAEPQAASVRQERYWQRFTQLVDWADGHTYSSIWSCLAAHAAVDHLDGITRRRLPHKCCGVFQHSVDAQHWLMRDIAAPVAVPQSRWNEVPAEALTAAGYSVVSLAAESGANIFVRERRSAMVFLQGHPEYESVTLLKEYRRDVDRYLRGEYQHYPDVPSEYFSSEALSILDTFRLQVGAATTGAREPFPYAAVAATLSNSWRGAAVSIYRNWLSAIAIAKRAPARSKVAS
jgi:homoserine O-succinyltransferase/O-acetyltransferase